MGEERWSKSMKSTLLFSGANLALNTGVNQMLKIAVCVVTAAYALNVHIRRKKSRRTAPKRLLLIGYGEVAKKLCEILGNPLTHPACVDYLQRSPVVVVGVVTRSKGAIYNPDGLNVAIANQELKTQGRFVTDSINLNGVQAAEQLDYDVLVELSTLSISERGEPALSHITQALQRGKHVVSANKGPLAFGYHTLKQLAIDNKCKFYFDSCVMDGCPVFNLARNCLQGVTINKIDGILNSTTNIILTSMENGTSFQTALAEAQARGIAEADPANDIEGFDAAAKLAALCNVLMGTNISPFDVEREGISHVTPQLIAEVAKQQKRLKVICSASRDASGAVTARVRLEQVDLTDEFATVSGSGSVLRIHSDFMTPISIRQQNPGLLDTAYGVLQDILAL